jgi:two-component system, NarL family, sensor histidine kinase UhpB
MSRVFRVYPKPLQRLKLSLFEKVILANSLVLICEALAGLWVTSHNLEAHHYLIDTSFIVIATLLGLLINVALLRASFRPLFGLLHTIRRVSAGNTHTRAKVTSADTEIGELAQAFNSMLDRLEQARREQAMLILQAQEEERRRLALELHDESSQNLSALLIHTEILSQSLQAIPESMFIQPIYEQLLKGLQQLNRLTQKTLDNLRILAQQLRPSVLDDLGLHSALRWLAEDSRERLQLPVEVHLERIEETVRNQKRASHYETTLFRIAQESLTNAARYAHAEHAWLSLKRDLHSIRLQVRDDGCGFDPFQRHAGLGIAGMRERAALLEGEVTIVSQPGEGTTVEACLPLSTIHTESVVHA